MSKAQAGDYAITVTTDGCRRGRRRRDADAGLRAKQRDALIVADDRQRAGIGTIKVNVERPAGFALERNYALAVRPPAQILAAPHRQDACQGRKPDAVERHVRRSRARHRARRGLGRLFDRARRGDPAWRARPLSVRLLRADHQPRAAAALCQRARREAQLALDGDADQRIRDAIEALLARQDSNGSFGLWSVGGDDVWLDAYVTDFLTRARERNFAVPDAGFKLALDRLRNFVATAPDPAKDGGRDLAYALYVLARNGAAPIGDLRYLADTKLDDADDADRQGADRRRARRCWATGRGPSGSMPRRWRRLAPQPRSISGARTTARRCATQPRSSRLPRKAAPRRPPSAAVQRVEAARARSSSDLDPGRCVAAAGGARDGQGGRQSLARCQRRATQQAAFYRTIRAGDLKDAAARHQQRRCAVQAVVSVSGAPVTPEPAAREWLQDRAA